MKSGIYDKYGYEVEEGDVLAFPHIDSMGRLHEDEDFRAEVVFKHGCFGYETKEEFIPLMNWSKANVNTYHDVGDHVPKQRHEIIILDEYPFWKTK